MNLNNEPSIEEIKQAFDDYIICEDTIEARSELLSNLINVRKLKTTWIGRDEIKLMSSIDNLLGSVAKSWRDA